MYGYSTCGRVLTATRVCTQQATRVYKYPTHPCRFERLGRIHSKVTVVSMVVSSKSILFFHELSHTHRGGRRFVPSIDP